MEKTGKKRINFEKIMYSFVIYVVICTTMVIKNGERKQVHIDFTWFGVPIIHGNNVLSFHYY